MTTVKNMQAFNSLIGYCTGYGGTYNPGRQTLRIESLQAQMEAVRQVLEKVKETKVHFDNEVNTRRQAFDQLPALAASVMRTLEASGAPADQLADARLYVRGIMGKSLTAKPPLKEAAATTEPMPVRRSLLQQAYVSKADFFEKLVQTVATESTYLANEAELSIEGLKKKVQDLHSLNERVILARVQWSNALVQRNQLMYDDDHSVKKVMRAVKSYLRAIFGLNSPQFEQVKRLRFEP